MIADYFFIRKKNLNLDDLYKTDGIYRYKNGYNQAAIVALLLGILPNIPGFLLQVKLICNDVFPNWMAELYHYAWFVGFAVSGLLYFFLMKRKND